MRQKYRLYIFLSGERIQIKKNMSAFCCLQNINNVVSFKTYKREIGGHNKRGRTGRNAWQGK